MLIGRANVPYLLSENLHVVMFCAFGFWFLCDNQFARDSDSTYSKLHDFFKRLNVRNSFSLFSLLYTAGVMAGLDMRESKNKETVLELMKKDSFNELKPAEKKILKAASIVKNVGFEHEVKFNREVGKIEWLDEVNVSAAEQKDAEEISLITDGSWGDEYRLRLKEYFDAPSHLHFTGNKYRLVAYNDCSAILRMAAFDPNVQRPLSNGGKEMTRVTFFNGGYGDREADRLFYLDTQIGGYFLVDFEPTIVCGFQRDQNASKSCEGEPLKHCSVVTLNKDGDVKTVRLDDKIAQRAMKQRQILKGTPDFDF